MIELEALVASDAVPWSFLPVKLYPVDVVLFPALAVIGITAAFRSGAGTRFDRRGANAERKLRIKMPKLLLLYLVFVCFFTLWGMMSSEAHLTSTLRVFVLWPLFGAFAYYISVGANIRKVEQGVLRIGTLASIYLSVATFVNMLGWDALPHGGFYIGVILLLPYSMFLSRLSSGFGDSKRTYWGLIIVLFGLLTSINKPVIAGVLLVTGVHLAFLMRKSSRGKGIRILVVVTFAVCAVALSFIFGGVGNQAISHISKEYFKEDRIVQDLSGGRLFVWEVAIDTWVSSWLLGHGLTFELRFIPALDVGWQSYYEKELMMVHNIYLDFLMKTGVVGIVIVALLLCSWLKVCLKSLMYLRKGEKGIYSAFMGFCGFTIGILLMLTYGNYHAAVGIAHAFWFSVGIQWAISRRLNAGSLGILSNEVDAGERARL